MKHELFVECGVELKSFYRQFPIIESLGVMNEDEVWG
jgi:hypothetical protein